MSPWTVALDCRIGASSGREPNTVDSTRLAPAARRGATCEHDASPLGYTPVVRNRGMGKRFENTSEPQSIRLPSIDGALLRSRQIEAMDVIETEFHT